MKKALLGFLVGILFTSSVVLASNLLTNQVNVSIDGNKKLIQGQNYILDNGVSVPASLTYDNTTYLPIRKISELLDLDIDWDSNTKTVDIKTKNNPDKDTLEFINLISIINDVAHKIDMEKTKITYFNLFTFNNLYNRTYYGIDESRVNNYIISDKDIINLSKLIEQIKLLSSEQYNLNTSILEKCYKDLCTLKSLQANIIDCNNNYNLEGINKNISTMVEIYDDIEYAIYPLIDKTFRITTATNIDKNFIKESVNELNALNN